MIAEVGCDHCGEIHLVIGLRQNENARLSTVRLLLLPEKTENKEEVKCLFS